MGREYRAVRCSACIWQDFYRASQSYPSRCPQCGSECDHEWFYGFFTALERSRLGRDLGVKYALGDPTARYKDFRDRIVRRRNYPAAMNV